MNPEATSHKEPRGLTGLTPKPSNPVALNRLNQASRNPRSSHTAPQLWQENSSSADASAAFSFRGA